MNLGKNPLEGAEGIVGTAVAKLSDRSLAGTHLAPYINKVRQQQKGADVTIQPEPSEPAGNPAPVEPTPVEPAPAPPAGPVLQPAPAEPKPKPKPKPTPKEVNKKKPQAKAIIEIGKKGSKYENGIQDWDLALEAARDLPFYATVIAYSPQTHLVRCRAALCQDNKLAALKPQCC